MHKNIENIEEISSKTLRDLIKEYTVDCTNAIVNKNDEDAKFYQSEMEMINSELDRRKRED